MAKKRIPEKVKKIVWEYAYRLAEEEKLPIEKVIIFGSHAKGEARKWSDIDVCIISSRFKDPMRALTFLLQKRTREEAREGLEPVGFTRKNFETDSALVEEIKKTGVVLR